jgi:hypothetical protein
VLNPFEAEGIWLRCALHAHTTNSDGELSPELLVRHYERARFDVLAITDHWVRTVERSTEKLLVIPSAELNATLAGSGIDTHVLALGVEADPMRPELPFDDLPETVGWILAHGGVPYVAHTYWGGLQSGDFAACEGLVGLEVYNAGCEIEIGRGLASVHWDEVLEAGRLLYGIAADDCHHPGYDSARAWVSARCAERSEGAVLTALREGSFYSSSGPRIHSVTVEEAAVEIRTSPVRSATLVSSPRKGARVNAGRLGYPRDGAILETNDSGEITAARLERPANTRYGRVEVEDASGARAWTNPLWMA